LPPLAVYGGNLGYLRPRRPPKSAREARLLDVFPKLPGGRPARGDPMATLFRLNSVWGLAPTKILKSPRRRARARSRGRRRRIGVVAYYFEVSFKEKRPGVAVWKDLEGKGRSGNGKPPTPPEEDNSAVPPSLGGPSVTVRHQRTWGALRILEKGEAKEPKASETGRR
jgi:hypothetical protein